jgi:dUTP pyrophosphatase
MKTRGFERVSYEEFSKRAKDIDIKRIYDAIIIPRRATALAAGYDFSSPYDFIVKPGDKVVVATGIKAYIKEQEYLAIVIRSSLGFKYNIRLCNQVGIVDADYYNNKDNEGHIFLCLKNEGVSDWIVKQGERIAQGIFQNYLLADGEKMEKKTRKGGIGSTGRENNNE